MITFADIEWDTSLVLTVILAPACLVFVGIIFIQWERIKDMKNDKNTLVAEVAKLNKMVADSRTDHTIRLAESSAQKDAEINRQKEEIEKLHGVVSFQDASIRSQQESDAGRDWRAEGRRFG